MQNSFINPLFNNYVEPNVLSLVKHRPHLYLGRVSIQDAWYFKIHCIGLVLAKVVSQSTRQSQCGNHYIVIGQTRPHLYLGRVRIQDAWYFWIHWIGVALAKLVSQFTSQWQCGSHYIIIGQTQASPILRKSEYTRFKIIF